MFRYWSILVRFFRRAIFERGWHVVPPEEEGGYIIPKIWKNRIVKPSRRD